MIKLLYVFLVTHILIFFWALTDYILGISPDAIVGVFGFGILSVCYWFFIVYVNRAKRRRENE